MRADKTLWQQKRKLIAMGGKALMDLPDSSWEESTRVAEEDLGEGYSYFISQIRLPDGTVLYGPTLDYDDGESTSTFDPDIGFETVEVARKAALLLFSVDSSVPVAEYRETQKKRWWGDKPIKVHVGDPKASSPELQQAWCISASYRRGTLPGIGFWTINKVLLRLTRPGAPFSFSDTPEKHMYDASVHMSVNGEHHVYSSGAYHETEEEAHMAIDKLVNTLGSKS